MPSRGTSGKNRIVQVCLFHQRCYICKNRDIKVFPSPCQRTAESVVLFIGCSNGHKKDAPLFSCPDASEWFSGLKLVPAWRFQVVCPTRVDDGATWLTVSVVCFIRVDKEIRRQQREGLMWKKVLAHYWLKKTNTHTHTDRGFHLEISNNHSFFIIWYCIIWLRKPPSVPRGPWHLACPDGRWQEHGFAC